MKPTRITFLSILGLAALLAAPASAQEQKPAGAKNIEAKSKNQQKEAKAKTTGETPAQDPAAGAGATGDEPATGKGGRFAGRGEEARAHMDVLKPVGLEEARYRKRIAQLDRVTEIATKNGKQDQLGQVAELRLQNDAYHEKRLAELRAQLGDQNVDAALAFIEKHGKGKAVHGPRSQAGREKAKNQTGQKADQRAGDAKQQRDRAKEKIKDAKNPDGQKPE